MSESNAEELRQRTHFINQCESLEESARTAKENLKREESNAARLELHELRGRVTSVLEDLNNAELD